MRNLTRIALPAVILALAVTASLPEPLYACPVCFDRDDEARLAFLATTGLLTALPLGLVFGTGAWLRKKARELAEADDVANPEVAKDRQ